MLFRSTGNLNRAMKRNIKRFPENFCFQITAEEVLKCQFGISNQLKSEDFMFQLTKVEVNFVKSQIATSQRSDFFAGQEGGRRKLPNVFTEQGIYMLSTELRGELAVKRYFKTSSGFLSNCVTISWKRFLIASSLYSVIEPGPGFQ